MTLCVEINSITGTGEAGTHPQTRGMPWLTDLDAALSKGCKRSMPEVQAQPGQQAEDTECQLVLGIPEQGSQALVGPPLPLGRSQDAVAGDVSGRSRFGSRLCLSNYLCQLRHDLQQHV